MSITVSFPWPSSLLSPNGRAGFREKARLTKQTRSRAAKIADEHGVNPITAGAVIQVTYFPPSARWDDDNIRAMGKVTLDGLADAMGANDRTFHPEVIIGAPKKGGEIEVVIEEIPA